MAELSPEAREALAQVLVTHAGYEQSMAEKFAADPKGMSARIFAAGIAFGATARQRQDAEIASERAKMHARRVDDLAPGAERDAAFAAEVEAVMCGEHIEKTPHS